MTYSKDNAKVGDRFYMRRLPLIVLEVTEIYQRMNGVRFVVKKHEPDMKHIIGQFRSCGFVEINKDCIFIGNYGKDSNLINLYKILNDE